MWSSLLFRGRVAHPVRLQAGEGEVKVEVTKAPSQRDLVAEQSHLSVTSLFRLLLFSAALPHGDCGSEGRLRQLPYAEAPKLVIDPHLSLSIQVKGWCRRRLNVNRDSSAYGAQVSSWNGDAA